MSSLTLLHTAIADYLGEREPWCEFSPAFVAAAAVGLPGVVTPIGKWIGAALEPSRGDPLVAAVCAALPALTWRQNTSYSDHAFLSAYAYCELVGPSGHSHNAALSAGLLCLKPNTHYPSHAHPAHEVYHLLSGRSSWQRGVEPWIERHAGARIEHPPGVSHAMRSLNQPMLALYLWRGELGAPARLVDQ